MLCTAILLWRVVQTGSAERETEISYSEFRKKVQENEVAEVKITNRNEVSAVLKDNKTRVTTTLPSDYPGIIETLENSGAVIEVEQSSTPFWLQVLFNASPVILLFGFWIFMMRQMQAGGTRLSASARAARACWTSQQKKVTFKDVAGVDEAKDELQRSSSS